MFRKCSERFQNCSELVQKQNHKPSDLEKTSQTISKLLHPTRRILFRGSGGGSGGGRGCGRGGGGFLDFSSVFLSPNRLLNTPK